jgi:hypothetical protein
VATITSLLRDCVTLQVRSVDRIYLQGYVPRLQSAGMVCRFLLDRGNTIPSPALLGRIGRDYVQAIERYAATRAIPVVRFPKGARKEEVARPFLEAAARAGRFGVVMVGVAQERASAWRGWRRGGRDEHPHFEYGRQQVFVNHYYFYLRDPEWGPAFIKLCSYAPWPVWIWLNGHEWAKRQAERAGIGFEALDNGFRSCRDAEALAAICARLGAGDLEQFFERWQAELPSPFTLAERERGYLHQLAFRQIELSDTRVFDRPRAGREWFERTIRDQLSLGRPDQVAIVFGRRVSRQTPGRFQTRIITRGVDPAIQIHYRASKVKQYLKQGRALRTETTVNDTRDFGVGRMVSAENWQALRSIGQAVNDRLLEAQHAACTCAPSPEALERIVLPSRDRAGQRAPGLRFGEPRTMALLAALCCFSHLLAGLTNRGLRDLVAGFLPGYGARQMTYDLRRLRRKGLIVRLPGSRRYELTPDGRRIAVFFTKTYARVVNPSLAELDPALPANVAAATPLGRSWRAFEKALDARILDAALHA